MAQKISFVSDLTGKDIPDDSEHASLIVLSHPTIQDPVRLDAHVLEASLISDGSEEMVQVEIQLPNDQPERVWITLAKFGKLFGKGMDAQSVLEQAEPARESEPSSRRRGRPAGSTNKPAATRRSTKSGRTPEELQAIRDWARGQGMTVADRGRVRADIQLAFDQAHAN